MTEPLWRWGDLMAATGADPVAAGPRAVTGLSIDTRTLQPGDLFVAIKGESQDGHAYVGTAFASGAAAAMVAREFAGAADSGAGVLLRVDDPLAGLNRLGTAARARATVKTIAITGSVGKTGSKEALRACLARCGRTHASEKSYNNHWGVPLTLARMPADTQFGVFEIGMNHPGEITPLSRMVRPEIAIITTVAAVHIGFFKSEEAIADAKAEIFDGLLPGGTAILNQDNRHYERLKDKALAAGAGRVLGFGLASPAPAHVLAMRMSDQGSQVEAIIDGEPITYEIGAPGEHYVMNSLAVLSAVKLVGGDLSAAAAELVNVRAPVGRGQRSRYQLPDGPVMLIDESYNANPASVRAALAGLALTPRDPFGRRIAVLGDMRELGDQSARLHRELLEPLLAAGVDLLLACGPHMRALHDLVPPARRGAYAASADELAPALLDTIRAGDAVMIKGSLGSKMGPLVEALKARLAGGAVS